MWVFLFHLICQLSYVKALKEHYVFGNETIEIVPFLESKATFSNAFLQSLTPRFHLIEQTATSNKRQLQSAPTRNHDFSRTPPFVIGGIATVFDQQTVSIPPLKSKDDSWVIFTVPLFDSQSGDAKNPPFTNSGPNTDRTTFAISLFNNFCSPTRTSGLVQWMGFRTGFFKSFSDSATENSENYIQVGTVIIKTENALNVQVVLGFSEENKTFSEEPFIFAQLQTTHTIPNTITISSVTKNNFTVSISSPNAFDKLPTIVLGFVAISPKLRLEPTENSRFEFSLVTINPTTGKVPSVPSGTQPLCSIPIGFATIKCDKDRTVNTYTSITRALFEKDVDFNTVSFTCGNNKKVKATVGAESRTSPVPLQTKTSVTDAGTSEEIGNAGQPPEAVSQSHSLARRLSDLLPSAAAKSASSGLTVPTFVAQLKFISGDFCYNFQSGDLFVKDSFATSPVITTMMQDHGPAINPLLWVISGGLLIFAIFGLLLYYIAKPRFRRSNDPSFTLPFPSQYFYSGKSQPNSNPKTAHF